MFPRQHLGYDGRIAAIGCASWRVPPTESVAMGVAMPAEQDAVMDTVLCSASQQGEGACLQSHSRGSHRLQAVCKTQIDALYPVRLCSSARTSY